VISYRFRIAGFLATAAIVVGACSAAATPSPTVAPTVAPTPTAAPATPTPAPTGTPAPTAVPLPTAPASDLITAGTLTICSDTSYPPQESLDANQKPTGSDIDLINEIGKRLGLTVVVKTTNFNAIIPALTGGTCDAIISAQTITADRQKQVDMIPYFAAGQAFVVVAGNPDNIKIVDDLCGKAVAAEDGTVEAMHINGTGDYKPADGLSQQCVAKGLKPGRHRHPRHQRGGVHGGDRPRRHPGGGPGPDRGGQVARHDVRQTMRRIVLPQAARVIIPPLGNEFNNMLKTTSPALSCWA
jgi:ABC-type amino acid transport substrate-binding protein